MKATGIVRRIDDLGRVVIPKEIRRTLKIREGMPMEIFTESTGEVILKKYSPVGEMKQIAESYVKTLHKLTGFSAAVCDTEQIIAASGAGKKDLVNRDISTVLEEMLRNNISLTSPQKSIVMTKESPAEAVAVFPITSNGDVLGGVILIKGEKNTENPEPAVIELVRATAMLFSNQMEE